MIAANARATDPNTSHTAARKQTRNRMCAIQAGIFVVFMNGSTFTDELLCDAYNKLSDSTADVPAASESSIRSRRVELVRAGLLKEMPMRGRTRAGNPCSIWTAA